MTSILRPALLALALGAAGAAPAAAFVWPEHAPTAAACAPATTATPLAATGPLRPRSGGAVEVARR